MKVKIAKRKVAVSNAGTEEYEQFKAMKMTRDDTRAQADAMFQGDAKKMRKDDNALLAKLFEQAPGAVTMAPNLQKTSSVEMLKLAGFLACGPDGSDNWLTQFENTPFMAKAVALEEKSLQMEMQDLQRRQVEDEKYKTEDVERRAHWAERDQIGLEKRMLALELAKSKAGVGGDQEQIEAGQLEEPQAEAPQEAASQELPPPPPMSKTSSIDTFFKEAAKGDEAQRRYPELLKAAAPAVNLKPRKTTDSSGPGPVRSMQSGGAT